MMTRLIPKIFYSRMADGLDLFVACLGFTVLYQDEKLAVIERDGAKAYLVEAAEFAARDRPEITIETRFPRGDRRCFIRTQKKSKKSLGAHGNSPYTTTPTFV
jgi:hypothetical protein